MTTVFSGASTNPAIDAADMRGIVVQFGAHSGMGVIAIQHPETSILVDMCLTPAIGLVPELNQHLNFITILSCKPGKKITEDAAMQAINYAASIIGFDSLPLDVPEDATSAVFPIALRAGPEMTEEDKLVGFQTLSAILCIPVTEECYQQNVSLIRAQARTLALIEQVELEAEVSAAPVDVTVH